MLFNFSEPAVNEVVVVRLLACTVPVVEILEFVRPCAGAKHSNGFPGPPM